MRRKYEDILEPISKLQKDLENPDPHFRQNAVIGLGKYFENEEARNKLKEDEKTKIVNHLLKCLKPEEKSMEVKTRTVKIFKEISRRDHPNFLEYNKLYNRPKNRRERYFRKLH